MTLIQRESRIHPDALRSLVVLTGTLAALAICILGQACTNESARTDERALLRWSISAEPSFVIGHENDPHYEFFHIVGAAALPDGDLVIADGASQELRIFDRKGTFKRTLGGSGEGPGQFNGIHAVATRGDTILAVDQPFGRAPRLELFHAVKGYLGGVTLRPEGESGLVSVVAISTSKSLLVMRGGWRAGTAPPVGTVVRDTQACGIVDVGEPQSQQVNWLGNFANKSWFSYELAPGTTSRRVMGSYRLGPALVTSASRGFVWFGDTGSGLVTVYDTSGTVAMQFDVPIVTRAWDEAALRDAQTRALAQVSGDDIVGARSRINTLYSSELRPPAPPRFTRMTTGLDGEMWVECFSEIQNAPHCAVVLDRTGREIGRVMIPADFTLQAVDRDRVIGVSTNEEGVERVAVYSLKRY